MADTGKMTRRLIAVVLAAAVLVTPLAIIMAYSGYDGRSITYIVCAVCFIPVAVLLILVAIGRKTDAKLEYDGLSVSGPMLSVKMPYSGIASLEMRDGMNYGVRTYGYGGISRLGGKFRNSEFGSYELSAKVSVKKHIIIRRHDGKVLVFNLETAEETMQFYMELKKKVGKRSD